MKLRPVNNWVIVKTKDLKYIDYSGEVELLEMPEYILEYEFKKGDKVLVDLTGAILLETTEDNNYIFAIDVDRIIGVYEKEDSKPHIVK